MTDGLFNEDVLAAMPFEQLVALRDAYAAYPDIQRALAPYEHRAFARRWAAEQPALAALSLPAAIPLYYLAKLLGQRAGLFADATPADLRQVAHGYAGLYEGLFGGTENGTR